MTTEKICNFCGRPLSRVGKAVYGPADVAICGDCVRLGAQLLLASTTGIVNLTEERFRPEEFRLKLVAPVPIVAELRSRGLTRGEPEQVIAPERAWHREYEKPRRTSAHIAVGGQMCAEERMMIELSSAGEEIEGPLTAAIVTWYEETGGDPDRGLEIWYDVPWGPPGFGSGKRVKPGHAEAAQVVGSWLSEWLGNVRAHLLG